jgi:hypothetical protein
MTDPKPNFRRKHLLTEEQIARHNDATAEDLATGHRRGNGVRVHGIYIVAISIAALVLLVVAIAFSSSMS